MDDRSTGSVTVVFVYGAVNKSSRKVIGSYALYCNGLCSAIRGDKPDLQKVSGGTIENTQVSDMGVFQCSCWLVICVKTKADGIECMLPLMASSFTNVCIPQGGTFALLQDYMLTTKVFVTSPVLKVKVVSFLVVSTGRFIVVPRPVKTIPEKSVVIESN